jgi:hypothetical protein
MNNSSGTIEMQTKSCNCLEEARRHNQYAPLMSLVYDVVRSTSISFWRPQRDAHRYAWGKPGCNSG